MSVDVQRYKQRLLVHSALEGRRDVLRRWSRRTPAPNHHTDDGTIGRFITSELAAVSACLRLEAEGLEVPETLRNYLTNELARHDFTPFSRTVSFIDEPPKPLTRK